MRLSQHGTHTLHYQALQCVLGIRFSPVALFPWLLGPHRFHQGASCHGNAFQGIVLPVGRVRGKMTSQQKECIYLSVFARRKWRRTRWRRHIFFSRVAESWQEENTILEKQACGTPPPAGPSDSSSRVCVVLAVSSPQADTCGFNPPYADGRLFRSICVSVSPRAPSLVSPHLSHQPRLCAHSCFFDSSLPFSRNPYFLFMSPANIFPIQSHLFDEVLSSFCLPPEHIRYRCTCHPLLGRIFEIFSYRSIATVSLQDASLTSHIPNCFERVMPKTSPSSADVNGKSCILNHQGSEKHTVCFYNCRGA